MRITSLAKHNIQIHGSADFSSITKEVKQLQASINQAFGKDGVSIVDENSLKFLQSEATAAIQKMGKELGKLKQEAQSLDDNLRKAVGNDKKSEELAKRRLDNVRKISVLEKNIANLKKTELEPLQEKSLADFRNLANAKNEDRKKDEDIRRRGKVIPMHRPTSLGMAGNTLSKGLVQATNALPGANIASNIGGSAITTAKTATSAGMGLGTTLALSGLAAAAGGAVVAIQRMSAAAEIYRQTIPQLLNLTGMGAKPITDATTKGRAAQLGFGQDPAELLRIQENINRSFGKAENPKGDQSRLLNILTASRDLAVNPEQMTTAGNQLRAQGGTQTAQKQLTSILDKAITSGMDKSQASSYLAAATGLLSELNDTGVANSERLLAVMADFTANNRMSPEMAARSIKNIQEAVAGSQGENNAFFQTAAVRGGLGGNTLLGTQFAVRQGLQGVDMGSLEKQIGDTAQGKEALKAIQAMGLGKKGFTQDFAKSILSTLESKTGGNTLAKLGATSQLFGARSAPEAAKTLAILEKMSKGTELSKDDKKILENLGKDPAESWRGQVLEKLDSSARSTAESLANLTNAQLDLGKESQEIFNKLVDTLTALDRTLAKSLGTAQEMPSAMSEMADYFKENPMDALKDAVSSIGESIKSIFIDFPATVGEKIASTIKELLGMDERGILGKGEDLGRSLINGTSNFLGLGNMIDPMGDTKRMLTGQGKLTPEEVASFAEPVKTNKPSNNTNGSIPVINTNVDLSEMVSEQKRTNQLLQHQMKPGHAGRVIRGGSTP